VNRRPLWKTIAWYGLLAAAALYAALIIIVMFTGGVGP
jgi:hypothetical protein